MAPTKADQNLRKHGVSFMAAARVFADMQRIERDNVRENYGEERFITVGEVNAEVLTVVYTMRGESIRIISARRASKTENEHYYGNRSF